MKRIVFILLIALPVFADSVEERRQQLEQQVATSNVARLQAAF